MKTRRPRNIYLTGNELLDEILACQKNNNIVSDKLARMLMLFVQKYSTKSNWNGYSFIEDMRGDALAHLCTGNPPSVLKFDVTYAERASILAGKKIFPNPFAWVTQLTKHSFVRVLNQQKRERLIRDGLIIQASMNPSYSSQTDQQLAWREMNDDPHVPLVVVKIEKPKKEKKEKKSKKAPDGI